MKKLLIRNLFVLIIGFISINLVAQNTWETKEQKYSGGIVVTGLIDVESAELIGSLKPTGKEVVINCDPFFDKYFIEYLGENGTVKMVLKFKEQNSGGKLYVDDLRKKNEYFVSNEIQKENKLILVGADYALLRERKVKIIFVFDDFH